MPTPLADQACSAATALSLDVEDAAEPVLVAVPEAVPLDEESALVRPTDSTNMEASEAIRAALAALGRGRPRGAIVLASGFDAELVASLSAGCPSVLVVRIDPYGPEPENCDVLAAHIGSDRVGGAGLD